MHRDLSFPLLLVCFFLSGLAALVYETAWTREFAFVFGTSELAVATVLAAYMGGLAAGAGLAARFADRVRRPVLAYGLLELGIALAALAVPLAIRASRALYVALFGGRLDVPGAEGLATAVFYLVCSFLILLVPTAMMGATLPLLARHAVRSDAEIGRRIGLLYACNTAGAVAGTALAAFVLLPALGLRRTIFAAAAVNALVFTAAWALARAAAPVPAAEARGARPPAGRADWILPLILVSGVVSFGYEVLWVRLLTHLVGTSTYAFATMLGSFLAGIALGSAVAARWATTPARASLGFAAAQLGIAGLSLAAFAGVARLPALTQAVAARGAPQLLADVTAAMLTLFPAALCIGATFPLAVRILARGEADAGSASARVYAANTIGCIAGSVGAGFFVVPALGYEGTLAACAATNLALAAGAAWLLAPRRVALAAVAGAAIAVLTWWPPATPWTLLRYSPLMRATATEPVTHLGVGRSATVVLLNGYEVWNLRTNGLPESTIAAPGLWTNHAALPRWLGALPVLARPEARSMLVVGLGGGVAVEVVPPPIERIDVVELEPEVVAANRAIGDRRWRDPLADPRLHLHLNDARNALLLSGRRFDAIVSQPSHPWSGGAAHLYTREFFELAASRLTEDGVFLQWMGLSFVDEELFRSLIATLGSAFSHVRVYLPPPRGAALFLASNAPLDVEATSRRALEAAPDVFAMIGIRVPEDVTSALLLDVDGARELARGAPIITDDHNLLQIRSPRLDRNTNLTIRAVSALAAPFDPLPGLVGSGIDPFYLLQHVPAGWAERLVKSLADPIDREVGAALLSSMRGQERNAFTRLAAALRAAPRHPAARAAMIGLSAQELAAGLPGERVVEGPLDPAEQAVVSAWHRGAAPLPEELRALDQSLAAVPAGHPLGQRAERLRAVWRIETGDAALAREAIELIDRAIRTDPTVDDLLLRARACVVAGEYAAALDTLRLAGTRFGSKHPQRRELAARGLRLARAIPTSPENADMLARVTRVYESRVR